MKVLYLFVLTMVLVCHPYLHTIIGFSEQTYNTMKFRGSYLVVLITIFGVKLYLMKPRIHIFNQVNFTIFVMLDFEYWKLWF